MASIFETLLTLPIFRGASRAAMEYAVGRFKFEFKKYAKDEVIAHQSESCQSMIFIISGHVKAETTTQKGIKVEQLLGPSTALAPEFLFGLVTAYPAKYTALEAVNTLEISKKEFLDILESDTVFKFNYLNMLARRAQDAYYRLDELCSLDEFVRNEAILSLVSDPQSTTKKLKK